MYILCINFSTTWFNKHKICIFQEILEKLWLHRLLASYANKNYLNVIFQSKYAAGKILYDYMQ